MEIVIVVKVKIEHSYLSVRKQCTDQNMRHI